MKKSVATGLKIFGGMALAAWGIKFWHDKKAINEIAVLAASKKLDALNQVPPSNFYAKIIRPDVIDVEGFPTFEKARDYVTAAISEGTTSIERVEIFNKDKELIWSS